jgi:hypothetical protein
MIFLAEGVEKLFILSMGEFFKNLPYETIELDCKFTVSIYTSLNEELLTSLGEIYGIRVRLGSTTTSVTVRNPNAQIIELHNDNPTNFSLQRIDLITKSYPMGIILYNVNPDAIYDQDLIVYWNKKPKILHLKNYKALAKHIIFIKLPQSGSLDCSIFDCCLGVESDV